MCHLGFGQEEEVILWQPQQKLTWADFKGEKFHFFDVAAVTVSGLCYNFSARGTSTSMKYVFNVKAKFYPYKSWYEPKLATPEALAHEQLHFDIAEVYARKLRKVLAGTKFTKNGGAEIKTLYDKIVKELEGFQNAYDDQTNFSRNSEQQLIWNEKIKSLLEDLK